MAEFLVKAVDQNHPDPEIDAAGAYKKGDIVVVMEDGHEWGSKEGPPKFVLVRVPGVSVAAAQSYRDAWQCVLDLSVVATSASVDGARIAVRTTAPGAANEYGITLTQAQAVTA